MMSFWEFHPTIIFLLVIVGLIFVAALIAVVIEFIFPEKEEDYPVVRYETPFQSEIVTEIGGEEKLGLTEEEVEEIGEEMQTSS